MKTKEQKQIERAEKRSQKVQEKKSVSEAKGLLKMIWKIFTGRL